MGKKYIFSIGGTGHKILRSIVHLAASGVYGNDDILVKVIDSDRVNGIYAETKETLEKYRDFYEASNGSQSGIFPNIKPMFGEDFLYELVETGSTLNSMFGIEHWKKIGDFAKFLFSESEREKELDKGFYGRTNIGPLVIEKSINESRIPGQKSFWEEVEAVLGGQEADRNVIILGSAFGGMGASGMPVLYNKLVNFNSNIENKFGISVIFCTPYFKFISPVSNENGVIPNSRAFGAKVRAALKYYESEEIFIDGNTYLYILGESEKNYAEFPYSDGGKEQKNTACPIELFAATAITHRINDTNKQGSIFTARRDCDELSNDVYTWNMLNKMNFSETSGRNKKMLPVSGEIIKMMKAAVMYKALLYREINKQDSVNGWHKNFNLFEDNNSGNAARQDAINAYFTKFIEYFDEIHKRNNIAAGKNGVVEYNKRVRLFDMEIINNILNASGKSASPNAVLENFEQIVQDAQTSNNLTIYNGMKAGLFNNSKSDLDYSVLIEKLLNGARKNKTRLDGSIENNMTKTEYIGNDTQAEMQLFKDSGSDFWVRENNYALKEIAKGQNFMAGTFSYEEFTVPTPWSAYLSYELILTDELFSELNTYAVNTWRGIIALIALRNEEPFKSKLNISISSEIETTISSTGLDNNETYFLSIVNGMREPQNYIFKNTNKMRFSVNLKKEKEKDSDSIVPDVIAFLSDDILITPVTNIASILKKYEVNKFAPDLVDDKGYFRPAHEFFSGGGYLRKFACSTLYTFLSAVDEYLDARCGKDGGNHFLKTMSAQIKNYREIAEKSYNERLAMNKTLSEVDSITLPYHIFDGRSIEVLSNKIIEYPFEIADLIYENDDGKKLSVVLYGERLKGISCDSPDAYYNYVYGDILYSTKDSSHFTTGVHDDPSGEHQSAYILNEKDIFCDTMIAFKNTGSSKYFCSENVPNSLIGNSFEVIFPIKEEIIKLFEKNIDILRKNLVVDYNGHDFTVKLNFKFKDGTNCELKKNYAKAESNTAVESREGKAIIFDKDNFLPMIAMYPYAKIKNNFSESGESKNIWRKYFYFTGNYRAYSRSVNDRLYALPNVKLDRDDKPPLEVRPLRNITETDIKEYRYYSSADFPLTLEIKGRHSKRDAAEILSYGYVFVKQPEDIEVGIEKYTVAVDFGTTSSGVFYLDKNEKPLYVQLGNEYNWGKNARTINDITNINQKNIDVGVKTLCISEHFEEARRRFFVTEQYYGQQSYLSAYENLDTKEVDNNASDAFIYGRILWQTYKEADDNAVIHSSFSLKWGDEFEVTRKYLRQLFTHICYRMVRNGAALINWKFSYPTSLGRERINDFERNIREILDDIKDDVAIIHAWEEGHITNLLSESIASARYFQRTSAVKTFISIDIGGGSSDIAFYFDDRGIIQTSVKYASRDMFVLFLTKFLRQTKVLFIETGQLINTPMALRIQEYNKFIDQNDKRAQYMLESILFEFSNDIIKKYDQQRQANNSAANPLKKHFDNFTKNLTIGFSALIYYIAEMIISMLLNNDSQRGFDFNLDLTQMTNITFGFCGKGSKIINWLGHYRREMIILAAEDYIEDKLKNMKSDLQVYKEYLLIKDKETQLTEEEVKLAQKIADNASYYENLGRKEKALNLIPDGYRINFDFKFNETTTKTETAQGMLYTEKIEDPQEIFFNADTLYAENREPEKTEENNLTNFKYENTDFVDGRDRVLTNLQTYEFLVKEETITKTFEGFRNFYNKNVVINRLTDQDAALYELRKENPKALTDRVNKMLRDHQKTDKRIESTFLLAIKVLLGDLFDDNKF